MRPGTGNRLRTGMSAVPPPPIGTATRLTTGMLRQHQQTGMMQAGAALNTNLLIEDRPITQQGLGGLKTGVKGPRRQIEDRSFFFGVLRNHINEISAELNYIASQTEDAENENQSYVQYEQMAEGLAAELRNLQGELGDYNTLVDKATIGHDITSIELDWEDVKAANERGNMSLERFFEERKKKEAQLKSLEMEYEQERRITEGVVDDMPDEQKTAYLRLKDMNQHMLKQLTEGQNVLDELSCRRRELELDISASQIKQEAMRMLGQLHEAEAKRDQLLAEAAHQEDPQAERERLLARVKEDNRETANMDREIRELNEKIRDDESSMHQINSELDDYQSERNRKFWELRRREQQIDTFLHTFASTKAEETEVLSGLEDGIVRVLEQASQYIVKGTQTNEITPADKQNINTDQLADQLSFKSKELAKSESTANSLDGERQRLQRDLQKIEQLEGKISQELQGLKRNISKMELEIKKFSDLSSVRESTAEKRRTLSVDQERLARMRSQLNEQNQKLSGDFSTTQLQLSSQDMHIQLSALEKKLIAHELTNHGLRETVAMKRAEAEFAPLAEKARGLINVYNERLKLGFSTKISL